MTEKTYQQALKAGSTIESFEILEVLGAGGFGITYKAIDKDLNYEVAIKEYLPGAYSWRVEGNTVVPKSSEVAEEYEYGLERFLDEAQTLARFKHPNIVRVVRYLRANGTAYLVMDYEYGQTLYEYLLLNPSPEEEILLKIALSVLRGLSHIHSTGFLHRDIKPGNIYIRNEGEALLIDFGAARHSAGEHSQSMTGIVTAGYAPFEQYSLRAKQGPTCDLYALGATLYRAILGAPPVEAPDRITSLQEGELDPLTPAMELGLHEYSDTFLQAIDWMLQPLAKERPQSALEVIKFLDEDEQPTVVAQSTNKGSSRKRRTYNLVKTPAFVFSAIAVVIVIALVLIYVGGETTSDIATSDIKTTSDSTQNTTRRRIGQDTPIQTPAGNKPGASANLGYLTVMTKPDNAKIYIDGAYAGDTPFSRKAISAGAHDIKITKTGYADYKQKIYITGKDNFQISRTLDILTAPLIIHSIPKKASIKFLNKALTYQAGMKLPIGNYDLSISAPGYKTRRMRFPVSWGKTLQGTVYRRSFTVALNHNHLLKKFDFSKYGRLSGVRYIAKLKLLLLSTYNNRLYIIDLAPKEPMTNKDKNPRGISSYSYGSIKKPLDLEPVTEKVHPYKLITTFYSRFGRVSALSKDRTRLLIASSNGKVVDYDLVNRKIVYTFEHNVNKTVSAISLSQDEKRMAIAIGTSLFLWDMTTKKQLLLGPLNNKVSKILITPDNRSLIVYRWYKPYFDRISLRDKNFSPELRFEGPDLGLYSLVFTDDKKMILAAGKNYSIKAWDLKTAKVAKVFAGHTRGVRYLKVRKGKLYSAAQDKTLRIWDIKTGQQLAVYEGHTSSLAGVDVASDGTMVTGDSSGKVYFWKQ